MAERDLFGEQRPAVLPLDGEKGQKERGAFFTPDALALAIARTLGSSLGIVGPDRIFEPGCGGGAFLRAARETWPAALLDGVDLLPACSGPGHVEQRDLFTVEDHYDLVLGNPDFAIAEKVVRHCLKLVPEGGHVALLLLASFEESAGRVPLFNEFPLYARQMIAQRASFTADGATDQRPYALFVWRRGFAGSEYRGLRPLVWR